MLLHIYMDFISLGQCDLPDTYVCCTLVCMSRLTDELDRRGIRYSWLARQLGVQNWTFTRYEGGARRPPADWYDRAAVVLGVSVESIRPEAEVAA